MRRSISPPALVIRIGLGVVIAVASVAMLQRAGIAPEESARLVGSSPTPTRSVAALPKAAAPTAAVPTASPRPTPTAFDLALGDAELTAAAASAFPQTVSGVTVSDPQVRVEEASVRLVAKARVLFGTTEFVMIATPTVADGRIAVRVESATLAGVSLPTGTRVSIADTVQTAIARLVPANVRVTAVAVVPGRITVQGIQP